MPSIEEIIAAVRSHAVTHYITGGWDVVAECWDEHDIIEITNFPDYPASIEEAVQRVAVVVADIDEYRKEVQATAF